MNEPSKTVPEASSATSATHRLTEEPKYDNFYSPQNKDFYSNFNYVRLDTRSIRLLRIQLLEDNEDIKTPIKCELIENQSLAAIQGKFTTISYCAGDPKQPETLFVNGLEFNAFSNLAHALRQARHFWKQRHEAQDFLLWADQVCINQSDPRERSDQINFMGDIYGSASQVLVCLSVEGSVSGAITWLQDFYRMFLEYKRSRGNNDTIYDDDMNYGKYFFLENYKESFHRGWDIFLATFFESPWWPRAWVRQEYTRSLDAYFMVTTDCIQWEEAAKAIGRYYNAACDFDELVDVLICPLSYPGSNTCRACQHMKECRDFLTLGERASKLLNLKNKHKLSSSEDLIDHLKEMYLCEASDPRDLVYACLGISSHSYGLFPSYTLNLSLEDVFIQVAHNYIAHHKDLRILRDACPNNYFCYPDTLIPSWVPDWRENAQIYGRPCIVPLPQWSKRLTPFFTFHSAKRGRRGRILQVRGALASKVFDSEKYPWLIDLICGRSWTPNFMYFSPPDQIYLIHGAGSFFMLRKQDEECFSLLGEVLGPYGTFSKVDLLIDELDRMIERNDPAVVTINLC